MEQVQWLDLLECPSCKGSVEPAGSGRLRCRRCASIISQQDGVYDFLRGIHAVVGREIDAIKLKDSPDPHFMAKLGGWLESLDKGSDDFPPADRSDPFLKNALLHRKQITGLLQRYPLDRGTLLVELGADHCWASGIFIDMGVRVIAVDISDHLQMAPRKDSGMLLRLKADMNSIPLKEGSADYVLANACVHHSWDLKKTFVEASRVLRPGGRFYLCSEPMPGVLRYALFRILGNFGRRERRIGINETLHRRGRWTRVAESAGFRPELVFPTFSRAEVRAKLKDTHLPRSLSGTVVRFLKHLQVSIHMVADKPAN